MILHAQGLLRVKYLFLLKIVAAMIRHKACCLGGVLGFAYNLL